MKKQRKLKYAILRFKQSDDWKCNPSAYITVHGIFSDQLQANVETDYLTGHAEDGSYRYWWQLITVPHRSPIQPLYAILQADLFHNDAVVATNTFVTLKKVVSDKAAAQSEVTQLQSLTSPHTSKYWYVPTKQKKPNLKAGPLPNLKYDHGYAILRFEKTDGWKHNPPAYVTVHSIFTDHQQTHTEIERLQAEDEQAIYKCHLTRIERHSTPPLIQNQTVYAILRADLFFDDTTAIDIWYSLKKVVYNEDTAQSEIKRLNSLNASKNSSYWYVVTILQV